MVRKVDGRGLPCNDLVRREEKFMKKLLMSAAVAVLALATGVSASSGWRILKSKSVSGQFAVTAISATARHPTAIAMRLIGHVNSGVAVAACSRGFSVSSNSRSVAHAGTFRVRIMRHAGSCDVTASVGGSGRVTVQILKR